MRYGLSGSFAALLAALVAPGALAQVGPTASATVCPGQRAARGDLGFRRVLCTHCSFFYDPDDPASVDWEFRSEPVIEGIVSDGPAAGRLQPGDTLVSIDGHLITTAQGGRRFGHVTPQRDVVLRVRRDGREIDVTIEPGAVCPDAPAAAPPAVPQAALAGAPVTVAVPAPSPPVRDVAPGVPRVDTLPAPVVGPAPPGLTPPGWLGFSLSCSFCGTQSAGADRVWTFSTPPVVESVEPGSPAYAARVRSGDRLTHLDGVSLTTPEGGLRFGTLRPGERVRLRLERDGAARETDLVVGARRPPASTSASAPSRAGTRDPVPDRAPQPTTVRFTGLVGNAFVEVTGSPVTVTETEGEIVIRSGDITVRVRKTEDRAPQPR